MSSEDYFFDDCVLTFVSNVDYFEPAIWGCGQRHLFVAVAVSWHVGHFNQRVNFLLMKTDQANRSKCFCKEEREHLWVVARQGYEVCTKVVTPKGFLHNLGFLHRFCSVD